MTRDMWHLTPDTWPLTPNILMCHMTHRRWWTLCQNCMSLASMVWEWRCFENIWTKGSLNHELINYKGIWFNMNTHFYLIQSIVTFFSNIYSQFHSFHSFLSFSEVFLIFLCFFLVFLFFFLFLMGKKKSFKFSIADFIRTLWAVEWGPICWIFSFFSSYIFFHLFLVSNLKKI